MPPPRPSPSLCTRCTHRLTQTRQVSNATTARKAPSNLNTKVPPESPSFIHVPEPVQAPNFYPTKPVKGVLPVSRNIFSRNRDHRGTSAYADAVTPEPKDRAEPHGPEAERIQYARQMSMLRRQTLREGLSEIWSRSQRRGDEMGRASGLKQLRNRRAASAPPPLDETLTTPSLHPSARLLLATGNAPGPVPKTPSKFPQHQQRRSLARRAALHNLYINAQSFIVTEAQLNAEIEKVFGTDEAPVRWNQSNGVWGLEGRPRTVGDMLNLERKGDGKVVDEGGMGRMRRVVETLTGGRGSKLGEAAQKE